jgi:formylglycine-generating enzyme required for sulfatase activity
MGADLYQCAANGQSSSKIDTCSSALACNANLGACSQCPAGRGPAMVNVGSFCIDSTEVTNAQYQAFLDTNPTQAGYPHPRCGFNTSFAPAVALGASNLPVIYVDWCDAYSFCKWSGKRLCGQIGGTSNPTNLYNDASKSQWYQACTSNNPGANIWPYGNTFNDNTCNGYNYPSSGVIDVGSAVSCHGPSAPYDAVKDMSGNADEWEDSCDNAGPTDGHSDTCRTRGGSAYDGGDPPSSGLNTPFFLSCGANWQGYTRNARNHAAGFRCCAP